MCPIRDVRAVFLLPEADYGGVGTEGIDWSTVDDSTMFIKIIIRFLFYRFIQHTVFLLIYYVKFHFVVTRKPTGDSLDCLGGKEVGKGD